MLAVRQWQGALILFILMTLRIMAIFGRFWRSVSRCLAGLLFALAAPLVLLLNMFVVLAFCDTLGLLPVEFGFRLVWRVALSVVFSVEGPRSPGYRLLDYLEKEIG